jgi:peptidyl-prolyl cis-trans isomerase SurA
MANKPGSKFVGRLVALVWLVSTLSMMPLYGQAEVVDSIVAIINEDIILRSELNQRMAPMVEVLKQKNYTSEQKESILEKQRKRMLEQMIYTKLADQQARRYNIEISEQEVTATIEQIKTVNKMTDESMRRMLELDGMTYEDYRAKVREKLLRTRLVNLEVKSKIVITDEDVKAYYDAHIQRYMGKTKFRLRHILLKVPEMASEEEQAEVLQRANELHKRLKAGEAFAELAKTFSDAASAGQGGVLGMFELNLLTRPIQAAIQDLRAGQFSKVVETEQGYQIFLVDEIVNSGGTTLDEARPEIQEKLYAEDVDVKYRNWLKALRESAHVKILE